MRLAAIACCVLVAAGCARSYPALVEGATLPALGIHHRDADGLEDEPFHFDLYRVDEGEHAGRLLMVASDRLSAYDFVLGTTIPDKGEILTRMSLWWFDQLKGLVAHHVVSTDVPEAVRGRAVICEALDILAPSSGETYMAYVERICASTGLAGETARLVKEADLKVNLARADSDTLRERYARSLPLVQNALAIAS